MEATNPFDADYDASGYRLETGMAEEDIDAITNEAVAPMSDAIVSVVFYSVPVLGAELPLIVIWLVAAAAIATRGVSGWRGI